MGTFFPQGLSTFKGPNGDLANVFYSLGVPVRTRGGTRSIYEDIFMRNLRAGRNPFEGLPDGMSGGSGGSGGGSGGGGSGGGSGSQNFGSIPQWWQDWYNAQGKHGGVPPVQGLL
jgi:hypothetical protein